MKKGKCGIRSFENIDASLMDLILKKMERDGSTVSGENPWFVDTNNFGIVLIGQWNASVQVLEIAVQKKKFFVPCGRIWEDLESRINHIRNEVI